MDEGLSLSTPISTLSERLLKEEKTQDFEDVVKLFNINLKKKAMIRAAKLSDVQDAISNQMQQRLLNNADEFSNQDLVSYFKVIQETLNKEDISMDNVEKPAIMIKNQQFNIKVENDCLSSDERQHVMNAVKSILSRYKEQEEYVQCEEDVNGEQH